MPVIFIDDWKLSVILRKWIFSPKHLSLVYQLVPRLKAERISLFHENIIALIGVIHQLYQSVAKSWNSLNLHFKNYESLKEVNDRLKFSLH